VIYHIRISGSHKWINLVTLFNCQVQGLDIGPHFESYNVLTFVIGLDIEYDIDRNTET
jgi:hypothetical protein